MSDDHVMAGSAQSCHAAAQQSGRGRHTLDGSLLADHHFKQADMPGAESIGVPNSAENTTSTRRKMSRYGIVQYGWAA